MVRRLALINLPALDPMLCAAVCRPCRPSGVRCVGERFDGTAQPSG
jgi:hypothetical protein